MQTHTSHMPPRSFRAQKCAVSSMRGRRGFTAVEVIACKRRIELFPSKCPAFVYISDVKGTAKIDIRRTIPAGFVSSVLSTRGVIIVAGGRGTGSGARDMTIRDRAVNNNAQTVVDVSEELTTTQHLYALNNVALGTFGKTSTIYGALWLDPACSQVSDWSFNLYVTGSFAFCVESPRLTSVNVGGYSTATINTIRSNLAEFSPAQVVVGTYAEMQ